jgi:outer membrane protein assembly factor BamA
MSVRNYKDLNVRVRWLQTPAERAELWTDYEFDDYTRERFFGLGDATTEAMRTSYGFRNNTVALRGIVRVAPRLEISGRVALMRPRLNSGNDPERPSTGDIFADVQAPGLAEQPNFLQTEVAAAIDGRDAPGNPTAGGFYRASFGRWDAHGLNAYDFRRADVTAIHYVPLTPDKRHVLSCRFGIAAATPDGGARVPFYFMPTLGGEDTIRSYMDYRFAAEKILWYGAEYHLNPRPYVSLAVFADAGKAARTWNGLGSADTKTGYGFGVIAHTSKQTLGRVDVAFGGGEGWQLWLSVGGY